MNAEMTEEVLKYEKDLRRIESFFNPLLYENLDFGDRKKLKEELTSLDRKIGSSDIPDYFKDNFVRKTKNYLRLVNVSQNSETNNSKYSSEALVSSLLGGFIGILSYFGFDAAFEKFSKEFFEGYVKEVAKDD